ncbi:MAG: ACT domain-containing protein [Bacteroidales bacterium]|jgi:ACT domain-containing protein|nr:ACT domain-containing protein [Bacteroidales bacterium]
MNRTIITAVGKDTPGIIARISTFLDSKKVNILDISQTIVKGFFNMMMIVDAKNMDENFDEFVSQMKDISSELGIDIRCQREDIFDMMHRI